MKKLFFTAMIVSLALIFLAQGTARATIITNISPEADALVNQNLTTTNYGSYFLMHVGMNSVYHRNAYLKFDLDDLSGINTSDLLSATLYLYLGTLPTNKVSITVSHVDSDAWLENTITFTNKPAAGAAMYTSPGNHALGWVAFNLLSAGNGWVSGDVTDGELSVALSTAFVTGNYGGSLGTAADYRFYPKENATATLRPYLRVEYNVVPEPSTFVLFGLGIAGLVFYRRQRIQ